ncbi:MAG: hypothetical protein LC793_15600, partial [Thermomicrobia bacterium]|nr:hypothetical protein [Thermomicrobia bacterium]
WLLLAALREWREVIGGLELIRGVCAEGGGDAQRGVAAARAVGAVGRSPLRAVAPQPDAFSTG